MSADFVPFLQSISARIAAPPQPAPFTPMAPASLAPVPAPPPQHAPSDVRVELKRDGDRISLIRVHCRCGEIIELACDYS